MSIVQDLRNRTLELSQSANRAGQNLEAFGTVFNKQRNNIDHVLRGSSQKKDQELLIAIADAERQVMKAVETLRHAATVARNYAHSV